MDTLLDHRHSGRSLTVCLGLLASGTFLASAPGISIPVLVWLIWLAATAGLAVIFMVNPVSESLIADDTLTMRTEAGRCSIPLAHIDHVSLARSGFGISLCKIRLIDGSAVALNSACLPSPARLNRALAANGVRVLTR